MPELFASTPRDSSFATSRSCSLATGITGLIATLTILLTVSEVAAVQVQTPREDPASDLRTLLEEGLEVGPWEWVREVEGGPEERIDPFVFPSLRKIRSSEWSLEDSVGEYLLLALLRESPDQRLGFTPRTLIRPWWEVGAEWMPGPVREVMAGAVIRMFPGEDGEHLRLVYLTREIAGASESKETELEVVSEGQERGVEPLWLPAEARRPTFEVGALARTETTEAVWEGIHAEAERRRREVPPQFQNQLSQIPDPWSTGYPRSWMTVQGVPGGAVYAGSTHLADSGSEWTLTWGQWVIVEGEGVVLEHSQSWGMTAAPMPRWAAFLGDDGPFIISFGWHGSAVRDPDGTWSWLAVWEE